MHDHFAPSIRRLCDTLCCAVLLAPLALAHGQAEPTFQDGVTTPPLATNVVKAQYTDEARKAGFTGFVIVRLTVDEQGFPKNVHVIRPIGMGLDQSAVRAVRQDRFKPAMRGGRPVAFPLSINVSFKPTS
jgi:TonB family protein